MYGASSLALAAIPLVSLGAGLAVMGSWAISADTLGGAAVRALALLPVGR